MRISTRRIAAQGSALLSALFIMTLIAMAATAMTLRLQIDIYKTGLAVKSEEYYLASQLVTFWGIHTLKTSYSQLNALNKKGSVAIFPEKMKKNYPGFEVSGEIYDMQGRFNLNNLRTPQARKQLGILLEKLNPEVEKPKLKAIVQSAWYWQNSYRMGRGQDSFMQAFLNENPPVFPAQMPFVSVSELRLIPKMNADIMKRSAPYLTALPTNTRININTSPKAVLASMGEGLSSKKVNEIVEMRATKPIQNPELSKKLKKYNIDLKTIAITSQFFLIAAHVVSKENTFTHYSLMQIIPDKKNKKKMHIKLLRESFNTL